MQTKLTNRSRKTIVEKIIKILKEKYVFPEIADKMIDHIQIKQNQGEYEQVEEAQMRSYI
ncbi:MAG: hypothetical protein ACXAC7_03265 [Candidatus Hodarchaeales archaeon]